MEVNQNEILKIGGHPLWVTPSLIVDINKYDESARSNYKYFLTLEFTWLFWSYNLWIDFKKTKKILSDYPECPEN